MYEVIDSFQKPVIVHGFGTSHVYDSFDDALQYAKYYLEITGWEIPENWNGTQYIYNGVDSIEVKRINSLM